MKNNQYSSQQPPKPPYDGGGGPTGEELVRDLRARSEDLSRQSSGHASTPVGFFRRNPWVGLVGTLASVVSVPLAIYLYQASLRDPDLVYSVSQNRSVIVQKDRPSGLRVDFGGTVIDKTDVVVMDVAVWNAGRGSIRPGNVLEPVFIEVGDGARVLTATTLKSARRLCDLRLTQEPGGGRIGVTWSILERNDGLKVQLIYAGPVGAPVRVGGVIESQGPVRQLGPMSTGDVQPWLLLVIGLALATIGVVSWIGSVKGWRDGSREDPHRRGLRIVDRVAVSFTVASGILFVALASMLLQRYFTTPNPPFGQ